MMKIKYYIYFPIIMIVLFSCTPQIRFAEVNKPPIHKRFAKQEKEYSEKLSKRLSKLRASAENLKTEYFEEFNLNTNRIELIDYAKDLIGTPYCWGGEDTKCTDCSGFVQQVYGSIGINLPRTAAQQYNYGIPIDDNDIQPGDLVFFIRKNKIGHVGIYLGFDKFIHSSSSKGVTISDLNEKYYRTTFAGARRIIETV